MVYTSVEIYASDLVQVKVFEVKFDTFSWASKSIMGWLNFKIWEGNFQTPEIYAELIGTYVGSQIFINCKTNTSK